MYFFSSLFGFLAFNKKIKSYKNKKIVIYSESNNYRNYFIKLIESLKDERNISIIYVTSDKKDLSNLTNDIKPIFIGSGFFRILLFNLLECDILLLTLTNLGKHDIKKSRGCKNYIYLFHSLVSTYKTYSHEAFAEYDIIFTNGKYQERELKEAEKFFNYPVKKIINTGYIYLEKLRDEKSKIRSNKVLFAPSWNQSKSNLFNDHAENIVDRLLQKNFHVTLRTHPELLKRSNTTINQIKSKFDKNSNFELNSNILNLKTINDSFILITDNGGIAMEYFIIQEKPVIYINYKEKIHNEYFHEISKDEIIEDKFKNELGFKVDIEEINSIDIKIKEAIKDFEKKKKNINSFALKNDIILKDQVSNAKKAIIDILR